MGFFTLARVIKGHYCYVFCTVNVSWLSYIDMSYTCKWIALSIQIIREKVLNTQRQVIKIFENCIWLALFRQYEINSTCLPKRC